MLAATAVRSASRPVDGLEPADGPQVYRVVRRLLVEGDPDAVVCDRHSGCCVVESVDVVDLLGEEQAIML